ncbi:hypothetical protein A2316_02090 [Candidatus Falkowbacteria bacterium RIFOXYB2_FULL_38_15]|uniref:Uncharacterized protein n=1 Tax=Candidatus Falkowbacteria bacterium RIFOXYA2_FULL_38_12 TaxID=1797993 RepID=A0A1F5S4S9_9BACT|nr:MAG: hypothetical protein A2257_00705 [Candidatus Falkowbacteria bacterium RIFOXYA2_FULL_38_12]OGF33285.1 MAG: hypothetical protein A2316_02090 [Candidatus Falkowbacteria bacterium RIFOXYB2_FULL_38_15]OGF42340.1 MAG: hypothetical protein A2555_00105 [Candidatus Falkowbacteria bacterium RIFOXYD2_FULL_39_16]
MEAFWVSIKGVVPYNSNYYHLMKHFLFFNYSGREVLIVGGGDYPIIDEDPLKNLLIAFNTLNRYGMDISLYLTPLVQSCWGRYWEQDERKYLIEKIKNILEP